MAAATSSIAAGGSAASKTVAKNRFYRPELDVLRFCAACGVFVFHAFNNTDVGYWVSHGWPHIAATPFIAVARSGAYGVDLFFALSSFLITELLLRERERTGTLDVKAFYFRRILRIWPLYFFFIAFAYALTFVSLERLEGKYIAGFLLLYGNWVFVLYGPPANSVAGALWTISLEEQFYLSWPQVVKRIRVQTIQRVAYSLLAVATVTRVLLALRGANSDAFWFNTLVRLDPLALGILFAIHIHHRGLRLRKIQRLLLGSAGAACWIAVGYFIDLSRSTSFAGTVFGYPAIALGSIAIIAATFDAPKTGWSIFSNGALIYLGKISYGIYIYHELGLRLGLDAASLNRTPGYEAIRLLCSVALALIITICCAAVSYRFLESPFLRLKDRYARVKSRPV